MTRSKRKIKKLKENDIDESIVRSNKIWDYIENNHLLLLSTEKIPDKTDEFIRKEYRTWGTFFSVLQAVSNGKDWDSPESDYFFIKKIWGVDYPCIHLSGDSILHEFYLEYKEISRNIFVINLWQYEDHHPFIYIVDAEELLFYSCLNETPVSIKNLIETSMEIGTDRFIRKCRKAEKKWMRETKKIRQRAKKLYSNPSKKLQKAIDEGVEV